MFIVNVMIWDHTRSRHLPTSAFHPHRPTHHPIQGEESVRITDDMILRAAKAMHAFYGVKAKPSDRDLQMMKYVLLVAIEEADPKTEAEMEDAMEYNHRNNP